MGTRGPAPKPADQRARHESKDRKAATSTVELPLTEAPDPHHHWRDEVVAVYQAARHVPRDPSEWHQVLLYCDLLEDAYADGFPASKVANLLKLASALGLTAADRRRNGVETKAAADEAPTAAVSQLRALKGGTQ
jgi:hypothetical protein